MLGFLLVLGQIPGTNFQITFSELLILLLLAIVIWEARRMNLHLKDVKKLPAYLKFHLLIRKGAQLKLPLAARIQHKNLDRLAKLFVH